MGDPQNGWFIEFITENPKQKWMIAWGTPISGNLHIVYHGHRMNIWCYIHIYIIYGMNYTGCNGIFFLGYL